METQVEKAVDTGMITKSVPMDDRMIKEIHKIMANHLERSNRSISFGEAARRLIQAGLEKNKKIG